MSRKANPTVIGAFTIGAIILIVFAILAFGSDQFLKKTNKYVVFFEGSVKGLDIGAPVSFRGVRVGSVSDVVMMIDGESAQFNIKVVLELEEQKTRDQELVADRRQIYQHLLERGLRAQLESQSMLTGKLFVALDFHPGSEMRLAGLATSYPEIPSIPTDMERLQGTLWSAIDEIRELPIQEIFDNLERTPEGLDRMANDPRSRNVLASLETAIQDVLELVRSVTERVDPIADGVEGTVVAARSAMEQMDLFMSLEDGPTSPLINGLTEATTAMRATLEQADRTLAQYGNLASEDSLLYSELSQALSELAAAARSIRTLSDYLERYPEALIQGKGD